MNQPQDKEGHLENLEHEAAGFMNPFNWGKKKKEEEEAKKAQEAQAQAQAKAQAAPPQAAPAPPPAAAPPITEPAATTPKPAPPPAKPQAPPAAKAERTYKVKSGDTLWDIAAQYYGDGRQYMKIAKANNIANPNLINVGVVLKIPD
ncbi:LysM peptidoglycan-binding domain-containing protein [Catellatospora methionotrophica]|uniref:LysM peptidoglycan-binding domain-containing protein n=1 Tax=Catellatospora methionotrophica TaxID=121620 RepID=UPI0033DD202F